MEEYMLKSLIIILLILPQSSYAFQNEPDSFRGIKWGTEIKALKDMKLKENGGNDKFYIRKNDKLKIGDADLQSIIYCFYNGKFYGVMIKYRSFLNFNKLQQTLFELYGEAYRPNQFMERYLWLGADVNILFDYETIGEKGAITYQYEPIVSAA